MRLASLIHGATQSINEFEQWLAINREGPWGSRLGGQKRALALAVEARLREVEAAVNAALPIQPMRAAARIVRGAPKLADGPDARAVLKAQALLALLCESRVCASYGGFGSVRTKVVEALDSRIDQYAEDLLDLLHDHSGPPAETVRAYLDVAAEFLGLVREPKAAEIVRRRAAVGLSLRLA